MFPTSAETESSGHMMSTEAPVDAGPKHLLMLVVLALVILSTAQDAGAEKVERSGKEVVESLCSGCHASGVHGAPRIGDKKAWSKLAARGLSGLSKSALKGIRDMPP